MAMFYFEWRKLRGYTLGWSLAVGVLIFAMLPVYYGMLSGGAVDLSSIGDMGVFELLGVDPATIAQPVGVYGFLTAFFSLAGGICGMNLGIGTFSKEIVKNTAEFTYTKPFKRGTVYAAKLCAAALSALAVGLCYCAGSAAAALALPNLDAAMFALVALSFLLIELFFLLLGALAGTVHPKIRAPLLTSSGVVFLFYIFSAFASKVNAAGIKYLTPFSWFGASRIMSLGHYDPGYLAACALFCVSLALVGLVTFIKKDVTFVA